MSRHAGARNPHPLHPGCEAVNLSPLLLWLESAHMVTLALTKYQIATYGSLFISKWTEAALTSTGKQPEPPTGTLTGLDRM